MLFCPNNVGTFQIWSICMGWYSIRLYTDLNKLLLTTCAFLKLRGNQELDSHWSPSHFFYWSHSIHPAKQDLIDSNNISKLKLNRYILPYLLMIEFVLLLFVFETSQYQSKISIIYRNLIEVLLINSIIEYNQILMEYLHFLQIIWLNLISLQLRHFRACKQVYVQ